MREESLKIVKFYLQEFYAQAIRKEINLTIEEISKVEEIIVLINKLIIKNKPL